MDKETWEKKGEGHRHRLREKFSDGGLDRFSDEEVVEFLLTLGTPRKDVKPQAREALKRFGSMPSISTCLIRLPVGISGIGPKEGHSSGHPKPFSTTFFIPCVT
jgi:DNA repair protein RadC